MGNRDTSDVPATPRAQPVAGQPTTYRGQYDMAAWWEWSEEVEIHSVGTFRPFLRSGDLVFDIGANRGRKVWIMRKLGARVIAVEPLFVFGEEFVPEFWWRWGGDSEVIPVARAIAPQPVVEIKINTFMPYVSSTDRRWMEESAHAPKHGQPYYQPQALVARKVPAITLDALVREYGLPRFIKVDVEGAEDTAIRTLSHPVPGLNMEFHADWIPVAAMEHMDGLGEYEWNYALDNRGSFVMAEWGCRGKLLDHMKRNLTTEGMGSWGDIYGRLAP